MSTNKKYKVNYIKWWDAESYKNGVSFTGWIKSENKAAITSYTIVIFNPETSDVPEMESAIMIQKEISGSTLSTLNTSRKAGTYKRKIEKAAYEEALRYKERLERTGFWMDVYKLNGFSKTKI